MCNNKNHQYKNISKTSTHLPFSYLALLGEGDGVEDDQLGELASLDAAGRGAAQHTVAAEGEHPARALLEQHVHGLAQCARSVHHVVN